MTTDQMPTSDAAHALNRSGIGTLSAIAGGIVWSAFAVSVLFGNELIDTYRLLLLLAVLVLAPLGFDLAITPDRSGGNIGLYRLARFVQPFAALAAAVSLLMPPGIAAGLLVLPWLLFAAMAGAFGAWRLLLRARTDARQRGIEEIAISAALIYLPIGATWLAADRLAMAPLGFGGVIAFLTAVHFHFAGFMAPIVAGHTGRVLRAGSPGRWRLYRFAAPGIIAGPPLVALGITFSSAMEVGAAVVLALCITLHGVLALGAARTLTQPRARLLLRIAAGASVAAMLLALLYAVGNFRETATITIPQMAATHGILNSLFGLCGLIAWCIERPR